MIKARHRSGGRHTKKKPKQYIVTLALDVKSQSNGCYFGLTVMLGF